MKPQGSFSLDSPRVECRSLTPREAIRLSLPLPPAPHLLFVEVPGLGRAPSHILARWKREASAVLAGAPQRFLGGPVRVRIVFADKGRTNLESRIKPVLDLLIVRNVIEDDTRTVVRELVLGWGDVAGCDVAIEPLAAERA